MDRSVRLPEPPENRLPEPTTLRRDRGTKGVWELTTLGVEVAVAGRKRSGAPAHELQVPLADGPTPARSVVEAVVRAEVGAFRERAERSRFLRVLTEDAIEEGAAAGSIHSGGRAVPAEVDPDSVVAAALLAHRDGLFQTIIDDEPIDDLDTVIQLRDGTQVMFLRLVALSGG